MLGEGPSSEGGVCWGRGRPVRGKGYRARGWGHPGVTGPASLDLLTLSFLPPENLPRRLAEFGVSDGCRLKCDDFLQNYQLVVVIMHRLVIKDPLQLLKGNPPKIISQDQNGFIQRFHCIQDRTKWLAKVSFIQRFHCTQHIQCTIGK